MTAKNLQQRIEENIRQQQERINFIFRQEKEKSKAQLVLADEFSSLRKKSRKLTESVEAQVVLTRLLDKKQNWIRPVETWEPRGKAISTLLRSLINHLICKYTMPHFWISDWLSETPQIDLHCFIEVAQGTSLYTLIKNNVFPIDLTRKQCHQFLNQRKGESPIEALRYTQIESFGGSSTLASVFCRSPWGERLEDRQTEIFRSTVFQWFSERGMMDLTQVHPLIDYIDHCYQQNRNWVIFGRTLISLIRDMHQWHHELVQVKASYRERPIPQQFNSSKIASYYYETHIKDASKKNAVHEIHTIDEILTFKDLQKEGRLLHHCVTSYVWNIEKETIAIFSYQVNGQQTLTIEVRRGSSPKIQQIRGKYNRIATPSEMHHIQRWASKNKLIL